MSGAGIDAADESHSDASAAYEHDSGDRFDNATEEEDSDDSDSSPPFLGSLSALSKKKGKGKPKANPKIAKKSQELEEFRWSRDPSINAILHPFNPLSEVVVGPRIRRSLWSTMSPIKWFFKFFTSEMAALATSQTNIKGRAKWPTSWTDMSSEEFWVFVSLVIYMGLMPLRSVDNFFLNDGCGLSKFSLSDYMTRHRFVELMSTLAFTNNVSQAQILQDRCAKIRPLLNMFSTACKALFVPGRFVAVDEAMIRCKSKFAVIKQRMPAKPVRMGIKNFCLCDAEFGYCYAFEFFMGKGSLAAEDELTATSALVKRLVLQLPTSGYVVAMDNYFSAPSLFAKLSRDYLLNCVGTCRGNRIPKEIGKIQERHLDRGEIVTVSVSNPDKTPMTLSAWRDNGIVKILSTFHRHAEAVVQINRRVGGEVVSVDAPSAIVAYQKGMGGVDLADHLRSTFCVQRKTYRWWFSIFYWVIDTAIINAFACQKFSQARRKGEDEEDVDTDADEDEDGSAADATQFKFRQRIVNSLLKKFGQKRSGVRESAAPRMKAPPGRKRLRASKQGYAVPLDVLASGPHWPVLTGEMQRCRRRGCGSKTAFMCETCSNAGYDGIFLCVDSCLKLYHEGAAKALTDTSE